MAEQLLRIIRRAEWGAAYAPGFGRAATPAAEVWLHHSVTSAGREGSSLQVDVLSVRLLDDIGQGRFGGGISYSYAITPSGRVFEGCGPDRVGSHTGGRNSRSRGLVLVGNYDVGPPTAAAAEAVAQLLVHGAVHGWWRTPALTGGHRDAPGASTACPGRYAHQLIPRINERARHLATAPAREGAAELDASERAMLVAIHDRATRPQDYRYHHGAPDDEQYGHVLATRREVHELIGGLSEQLATVQTTLGQLLAQSSPVDRG